MIQTRTPIKNQAGMVSIMVTMVMMLVISLIVLGFAQVSRREQRQTLDRQLSSQAFLAAESGVNDARKTIQTSQRNGVPIPEKTTCVTSLADPDYKYNPVINAANDVSYTCLLVTAKRDNLHAELGLNGESLNFPIEPAVGRLESLTFKWNVKTPVTAADVARCSSAVPASPGAAPFPNTTSGDWRCPYGALRIDLVPTDNLNRTVMASKQKSMVLYPTSNSVAPTSDYAASDGRIIAMSCTAANGCQVTLNNMFASGNRNYGLRITALYNAGVVDISGVTGAGAPAILQNAQAQVDSTGKAQDVLRRIQVRLPLLDTSAPDYAIESASSVCKRFAIGGNSFEIPTDIRGQDVANNPMCAPLVVRPECKVVPRDIAMVLDISLSMLLPWQTTTRIDKLKQVSRQFIGDANISQAINHESLIEFNNDARKLTPFTYDTQALSNALETIQHQYGTNFFEGMNAANEMFNNVPPNANARAGVKKVVVFISDGLPVPAPTGAQAEALALTMKNSGVEIYTIAITADGSGANIPQMRRMATQDGNHFVSATQERDLEDAIRRVTTSFVCE